MTSVLLEMLEAAVHTILYVRNIYPKGTFEKFQKYNIALMMNCHPDVNNYIKEVFTSLETYIEKGDVDMIIVQIVNKVGDPIERYCFELKIKDDIRNCNLFDLEQQLRAILLKLSTCDSMVLPLPDGCLFQILAHTKDSALHQMEDSNDFQSFPWAVADLEKNIEETNLVPIRSYSNEAFVLQCYIEEKQNTKLVT